MLAIKHGAHFAQKTRAHLYLLHVVNSHFMSQNMFIPVVNLKQSEIEEKASEKLQELAKVWRYGRHVATSAATVALIAPETDDPDTNCSIEYDLGQATMSMMLAAADLGIGSGHSAVMDQDQARKVLGLPKGRRAAYLIAFGYPAERPLAPIRNPNRRPFADVVHRGRW